MSAAKERPILFSAPMVRALLDGTKTQTRRVVKPQPVMYEPGQCVDVSDMVNDALACPYGQPGDHLWVRESFWGCDLPGFGDVPCVVYDDEWQGKEYAPAAARPWARKFGRIPSIHMPRECSRILLEIVSVRVERLNDCTEQDAIAEGISKTASGFWSLYGQADVDGTFSPRASYRALWESINGPGSWDANPWVWVVEFRRATTQTESDKP